MFNYKMIEGKSKKECFKAWKSLNKMQRANLWHVKRCSGFPALGDIADNGADKGSPGLTCNYELIARVKRNKTAMFAQIVEDCEALGMDIEEFLTSFSFWERASKTEILGDIISGKFEITAPGLCWYFAESGAQDFVSAL